MGNVSKGTAASLLLVVLVLIGAGNAGGAAERIEVKAGEFHATQYLSETQRAEIKRTNLLTGYGEAEYVFRIPQTGWYEFWVESCAWSTDLLLDGRFLTHTTFTSGEWKPDHDTRKVLNLYLAAGDHTLRFVRPGHPVCPTCVDFSSSLPETRPAWSVLGRKRTTWCFGARRISRCNCRRGDWLRPMTSI